jgi:hypothetical protein
MLYSLGNALYMLQGIRQCMTIMGIAINSRGMGKPAHTGECHYTDFAADLIVSRALPYLAIRV